MGAATYGAAQTLFFTLLLIPFGLRVKGGVPGAIVMLIAGGLTAIAVAGFMAAMALRTGSSEAVQGVFPLVFIALFFSSAFFPLQTMTCAYRHIANLNPISYLIEGLRELCINGFSAAACAKSLLVPIAIMVVSFTIALRALSRRVVAA